MVLTDSTRHTNISLKVYSKMTSSPWRRGAAVIYDQLSVTYIEIEVKSTRRGGNVGQKFDYVIFEQPLRKTASVGVG